MTIGGKFMAALLPVVVATAGCGDSAQEVESIRKANPDISIGIKKITDGRFSSLGNGLYQYTIPAKDAGTANDLNCLVGLQSAGSPSGSPVMSMSCDYIGAHGLKP